MSFCIINGRLVPAENAAVSIQDRGFRYGDGVFETIAVHDGVPYQFGWHMQRLAGGLAALRIAFDTGALRGQARQLLHKNAVTDGLLRLQVTRGAGSRGYLPVKTEATCVIETAPMPEVDEEPVALWLSRYAKISARALPVRYKSCQGLNSTLARMEADDNHCADALLLNEQGQLCETSSGNLFWLKQGTLFTPALACGILEGSTRAAVMRLSPYPVQEAEAGPEALARAEAVFMTNVVWRAAAVGCLMPDGAQWDSAAVARDFRRRIDDDRAAASRDRRGEWQADPDVIEKYGIS